ncbi:hypothetical protein [Actinoplanes ianthinogenes]|uniref:hypothetical protein n=1 Tax=Actinoplanes ianthinogenes TaxID=122358 RepID=UPI0016705349|nr:hypothetical protein [Actinoplanes ianthinogenes]
MPEPEAGAGEQQPVPEPEAGAGEQQPVPDPESGAGEQQPVPDPEAGSEPAQETPAGPADEQPVVPDPGNTEPVDQTPQDATPSAASNDGASGVDVPADPAQDEPPEPVEDTAPAGSSAGPETPADEPAEETLAAAEKTDPAAEEPPASGDGPTDPPDESASSTEADEEPPPEPLAGYGMPEAQDTAPDDPEAREPVPDADTEPGEAAVPPEDTTTAEEHQRPVPDPFAPEDRGLDPEPGESPASADDSRPPAPDPDEPATDEAQDRNEDARWEEVRDLLPADESGRRLTPRDCQFLEITPDEVQNWSDRTAPLGMTPEQYTEFRSSLSDALRADGIDPAGVDARLQGSSARFFSGRHKSFPERDGPELAGSPEAQAKYDQWIGDGIPPQQRPFDSMNKLGVKEAGGEVEPPSDYDVQLSSDQMVERAEAVRQQNYPDKDLFHPKYDFVRKAVMDEAFPNLQAWRRSQEAAVNREVAPAVFPGSGPPDKSLTSANGMSAHHRDDDWKLPL